MLKKMGGLSLRRQLIILFSASIVIVVLIQVYYTMNIFQRRTEENTTNCYNTILQTDAMLTQVSESISSIGNTVASNEYIQEMLYLNIEGKDKNLVRRMELQGVLMNYLDSMIGFSNVVSDIALIDSEQAIVSTRSIFNYLSYKNLNIKYDLRNIDTDFFSSIVELNNSPRDGFAYIVPVYYTTGDFKNIDQRLGTIVIWCNLRSLIEIVEVTAATEGATVLISDSDGAIMALKSNYAIAELGSEIESLLSSNIDESSQEKIHEMKFMDQKSFILVKEHNSTGWKSINIVPIKGIYAETYKTLYLGMGIAISSIVILIIFGIYMYSSISRPLVNITEILSIIGNENRKARIKVIEKNEFGIISDSINTMLDKVDMMNHKIFNMQSQLYEKELMQKETELLTLQSQINPHFLYNTLECIRAISVIHRINEIPIITTSMAKIFRYSIKGGVVATIGKELESVNDYYKIIAIRYNERLTIEYDVEEELKQYSMLKMSLQPIIENTVYHGLEATEEIVNIKIVGRKIGEYALLSIQDNGVGMEYEKACDINDGLINTSMKDLAEVSKSRGSIGLNNINARIKLHYGEECGLQIMSTKELGTTVNIKIKLLLEV